MQVSARRYATESEPRRQDTDNTLLYAALGVVALGGGYYYFKRNPDEEANIKKKARADETEMKQKARESTAAARSRADDTVQEGKHKYEETKVRVLSPYSICLYEDANYHSGCCKETA